MAVKASELFKILGDKLGLPADSVAKLSGNTALNIDVDDDVANLFKNTTVFTEESAKANPSIRAAIRAEALDGVDADVKRLMAKHEMTPEIQAEILKADKTSAKLERFYEKLAELEKSKASASGQAKTNLEKEVERLNAQIVSKETEWQSRFDNEVKGRATDRVDWELKSIYAGFDYALDNVPKEDAMEAARAIANAKLRQKGVIFKMADTGLAPFTKDDTPYFEGNVKISAGELLKKTLLESNLLKVSGGRQMPKFPMSQNQTPKDLKVNTGELDKTLQDSLQRDGFGG
jgi:hypothetical protein